MGSSQVKPSPSSSAPLWSTYITVFNAHFLSHFAVVKFLPLFNKWNTFNCLTAISTEPQASWSPRIDNVNPMTSPCYLTISQSEACAQADHRPCLPHLAFKKALLKHFWELRDFLGQEQPVFWHGPAISCSMFQIPSFQSVWPHWALSTWTCINRGIFGRDFVFTDTVSFSHPDSHSCIL